MLSHDLATTFVADRDRAIRDASRARIVPARPSLVARVVSRLASSLRPRTSPRPRPARGATRVPGARARELGAVTGVSARPGDTHGQGAC